MENHILEGSYPDTVPAFTPRDANPNHKVSSIIVATNLEERPAAKKTKMDVSPPGIPACKRTSKRHKLKLGASIKDFTKWAYFVARKEHRLWSFSPPTSQRSIALSFVFTTKNAPSQNSLANLSMSASGKRSLPMIKLRFSNTVMPVVERSGSMQTLLPSIGMRTFPGSLHTS